MDKSKKRALDGHLCNSDAPGSAAMGLEKLLRDTCKKLENQQKWQHQNLQSLRELFEQQQQQLQNQFQHLQQQQESQFKILQQQMQRQQESQFKLLQQQIQQQSKQNNDVQGQRDITRKPEGNLDEAVQSMKDKFLEMKNTVLNQLEEEKVFLRESVSKAQNDILTQLSRTGEDVSHVKEVVGADALARMEKQIGQVQSLCEEQLQTQQKKMQEDQSDTAGGGSQEIFQDSLKTLVEDLETSIEEKLENAVGSLKKELQEIKENNVPAKVRDKEAKGESPLQPDNSLLYDFYINLFIDKCFSNEQYIENTPLYVDMFQSTVRGYVQIANGDMEVYLAGASEPHEQKFVFERKFCISVSIVDVMENLPAKKIGMRGFTFNTEFVTSTKPLLIACMRCHKVIKDSSDLLKSGALLLRYKIWFPE